MRPLSLVRTAVMTDENGTVPTASVAGTCGQLARCPLGEHSKAASVVLDCPLVNAADTAAEHDGQQQEQKRHKKQQQYAEDAVTFTVPITLTPRVAARLLSTLIKSLLHLRGQMPCIWPFVLDELRRYTEEEDDGAENMKQGAASQAHRKAEQASGQLDVVDVCSMAYDHFVQGAETWFASIQQCVQPEESRATTAMQLDEPLVELCIVLGSLASPKEVYDVHILGDHNNRHVHGEENCPPTQQQQRYWRGQLESEPTELELSQCERKLLRALMDPLTQSMPRGLTKLNLLMKSHSDDDGLPPQAMPRRNFQPEVAGRQTRVLYKRIILDGRSSSGDSKQHLHSHTEEKEEEQEEQEQEDEPASHRLWFQLSPTLNGLPPWPASTALH
ncbi:hypothetical protein SYNPS1DRAFT_27801 [Syncephalis pseudoplumigaleata]|uniref:Uncharacterized protein n=1 Tax=Syncephalis pseudoplumigaleata TaxID=1712513 RepID=A0A4P9Z1X5_9FUNG|nr:hypothetical protein SYNPS1DRAFT_27801 [Syncephalis pseudoplumigaleata]|eukprot:RKP26507.1 hypothetical protein SYNPS1DRAFT_27801 [Syncephalis pseudoplumigaleata]